MFSSFLFSSSYILCMLTIIGIRFLRGPFQGIEGTIKRIRSNRHLVIALPHVGVLVITIPSSRDIEFIEEK